MSEPTESEKAEYLERAARVMHRMMQEPRWAGFFESQPQAVKEEIFSCVAEHAIKASVAHRDGVLEEEIVAFFSPESQAEMSNRIISAYRRAGENSAGESSQKS